MVVGREHRSDARCDDTGHLPTKTMANESTTGSDKNPTTDESTTEHEYEPREDEYWVDSQFIGGRYDY